MRLAELDECGKAFAVLLRTALRESRSACHHAHCCRSQFLEVGISGMVRENRRTPFDPGIRAHHSTVVGVCILAHELVHTHQLRYLFRQLLDDREYIDRLVFIRVCSFLRLAAHEYPHYPGIKLFNCGKVLRVYHFPHLLHGSVHEASSFHGCAACNERRRVSAGVDIGDE